MRRFVTLALLVASAALGGAAEAGAQQVSQAHRRLLMVGVYGTGYALDAGEGADRERLGGFGGRLLVNLAPFSGPGNNLLDNLVLGGFVSRGSGDDVSILHSGAELDLHLVYNPLGGFVDPFLQVGVGRFRVRTEGVGSEANFALSPGAGVRVPLRGLVELRVDARDIVVFGSGLGGGDERTTHNLEATAGLQLRF